MLLVCVIFCTIYRTKYNDIEKDTVFTILSIKQYLYKPYTNLFKADHVPYRSKGSYSFGQCKYYVNKTALNVTTLLLPVLNALVANRKDETLSLHETKINRLQVGVRKKEYASDALDQYSRCNMRNKLNS